MALDPTTAPSLTTFKLLSFDIFETLIDVPTGVAAALQPLISKLAPTHPAATAARQDPTFLEQQVSAIIGKLLRQHPTTLFTDFLVTAYDQLAADWGLEPQPAADAAAFANTMGNWPAYPDSVAAMQALGRRFKLVALTNITNAVRDQLAVGPLKSVPWDAVYTGEDIRSYKPDRRNFDYLFEHVKAEFGVEKSEVLHVAQGRLSDHGPAKEMDFASAWIARRRPEGEKGYDGVGEDVAPRIRFGWRWGSLGAMAKDVEAEFAKGGS